MTRYRSVLAVAVLVVLAGCSGVSPPSSSPGSCDEAAFVLGGGGHTNQIDPFEHLTVTVTTVELEWASASSDERVTIDIEDRRIDLAQRQGETMTLLENASVPNGTYEKAFLHVTNASGTLKNGTQVNVRVRVARLKVTTQFTASGNASRQFTVEPTVVLRHGSYVLKSRLGGSGCGCC